MLMNLDHHQFELIKQGTKTIEIRLNDQKRRHLKIGDPITFNDLETHDQLAVQIKNLTKFDSFEQLLSSFNAIQVGSSRTDSLEKRVADIYQFYNHAQERESGVLAIEF